MKSKRVKYCDFLKLLSIYLVIVIHTIAGYRDKYLLLKPLYYHLLSFIDSFTRVGVSIFFMITGCFMLNKNKEENYSLFLKKRLPKLVIPFILFSLFYYIYECHKVGSSISMIVFLTKFSNGTIKYHLWFMYYIILIYLFIPYLQTLIVNLNKKDIFNFIILIFIFENLFHTINSFSMAHDNEILHSFVLPNLIGYINYLFIGYYLYNYKVSNKYKKLIYLLGIISLVLLPIADKFFINGSRNDEMFLASNVFAFFPAISLFILVKENYSKIKFPKALDKIINNSGPYIFYIYMSHVYILEKIEKLLSKYIVCNRFLNDLTRIAIVSIIVFILSYLLSIVLNYIYNLILRLKNKLYN